MNVSAGHPPTAQFPAPLRRAAPAEKATLLTLAAATLAWSVYLWPQWRHNPDLSHGLVAPVVLLALLHEARRIPNGRFFASSPALAFAVSAGLVAALSLLGLGGLYATALGWDHALVAFLLTAALSSLIGAVGLSFSSRDSRILPYSWPAAAAVLACLLSAPIPPGSYTELTQHLQRLVTSGVLTTLHLLGIAAVRAGNVLHLAHVQVGVEEACSGVRSLVSCLFAGIVLSALLVRRPWQRVTLTAVAAPLAVAMNFVRSLTLTLLANAGVEIQGAWHDLTGLGILVLTAALLVGLAAGFERFGRPRPDERPADAAPIVRAGTPPSISRGSGLRRSVLATSCLGLAALAAFVLQTRPTPGPEAPAPAVASLLPDRFDGWEVRPSTSVYAFSSQLQTTHLAQTTYVRSDADGVFQVTVYLAYWPAGQAPVSLVASHTPDACWPGTGWREDPAAHGRVPLQLAGRELPAAERRRFTLDGYPQNVWYWHLYDGYPVEHEGVGSPARLLSLAWHYGFRKEGAQWFIRISSNRPWTKLADEPLVAEVARRLQSHGFHAVSPH